ncbi:MAG: hypothetical protein ACK5LS_02260 [Propioniciclava sp.]
MSASLWAQAGIIVAFGLLVVIGGVPFVERMFRFIDRPRSPAGQEPHLLQAGASLRGGTWIGALERLSVYGAILAGYPAGIAVVVALKGLARYPELRASSAGSAERFIIGTFLSLLLASGGALAAGAVSDLVVRLVG